MAPKERKVVKSNRLVEAIQQIAQRGDSRRICLLNEEKHLLDIPLSTGDPASTSGVLEAPVLAAIRAFASLINECTVEVEKIEKPDSEKKDSPA